MSKYDVHTNIKGADIFPPFRAKMPYPSFANGRTGNISPNPHVLLLRPSLRPSLEMERRGIIPVDLKGERRGGRRERGYIVDFAWEEEGEDESHTLCP